MSSVITDINKVSNGDENHIGQYANYLSEQADKSIAYANYIAYISIATKDFIFKYHSQAMSDTLKSMSHESLEEYASVLNDMILFQEILAGKLDMLIRNTLDSDAYKDFKETYMDEESALKKYKREVKINQITDVNEHSR